MSTETDDPGVLVGGAYRRHHVLPMWTDHCIHGGPTFYPPYRPLGLRLHPKRGRGRMAPSVSLSPPAEEYALAFADVLERHARHGIPPTSTHKQELQLLHDNFWRDWLPLALLSGKGTTGDTTRLVNSHVRDWDWKKLARDARDARHSRSSTKHVENEKTTAMTTTSGGALGLGAALVDGVRQPMTMRGMVDRPGIFLGRGGDHHLNGRIRRRITPADVDINLSADAPVPVPLWRDMAGISPSSSTDPTDDASSSAAASWGFVGEEEQRDGSGGRGSASSVSASPPSSHQQASTTTTTTRRWRMVLHDPLVSWLARWDDPLTGKPRYISLDHGALHKQRHERAKFDMARRLQNALPRVRATMIADATGQPPPSPPSPSPSPRDSDSSRSDKKRRPTRAEAAQLQQRRQAALCACLVDAFSIRAGEGGRSDGRTIGATALRAKHINVADVERGTTRLRFRGKDQVCFDSTRPVRPPVVARALAAQVRRAARVGGGGAARVFWRVEPDVLNRYLDGLLPGLTSKTMRTRAAGALVEGRLSALPREARRGLPRDLLAALVARVAMAEVAWLCNHKRSTSTSSLSSSSFSSAPPRSSSTAAAACDGIPTRERDVARYGIRKEQEEQEQEGGEQAFLAAAERAWQLAARTVDLDTDDKGHDICAGCVQAHASRCGALRRAISDVTRHARRLRLSPETAKVNYVDPRIVFRFIERGASLTPQDVYSAAQLRRFSWALHAASRAGGDGSDNGGGYERRWRNHARI